MPTDCLGDDSDGEGENVGKQLSLLLLARVLQFCRIAGMTPDQVLRCRSCWVFGWLEVLDRLERLDAASALNVLMAGNQLAMTRDGLRDYRLWMTGPRGKAAEVLQQKYEDLQRLLGGGGLG